MTRNEVDEDFAAEQRELAAAMRAAARRVCPECGMLGGHTHGCPADPDEDDDAEGQE